MADTLKEQDSTMEKAPEGAPIPPASEQPLPQVPTKAESGVESTMLDKSSKENQDINKGEHTLNSRRVSHSSDPATHVQVP